MQYTVKCTNCKSTKVRMFNPEPLSEAPYEGEPYLFDAEAYTDAICDDCKTIFSVRGPIIWNKPSNLIESLEEAMNQHLVGKTFVYKSKYGGETFGIVAKVFVSPQTVVDSISSRNFEKNLDWVKKGRPKDKMPILEPVVKQYTAHRPSFRIKSTNGIRYDLNEIFILQ